jgi:hypothetical protein
MVIRIAAAALLTSLFIFSFDATGSYRALAQGVTSTMSPSPSPTPAQTIPENPAITALAQRWVQHLESKSAEDLKPLMLKDGPVLVVAPGVLSGQGDPTSVQYAGGSPPAGKVALYTYLYDFHFAHSNVREILMIDATGNVHQVMFTSDHPLPLSPPR